ncbi:hypothetical protein ACOMHN_038611 [Nucella lapillus]
MVFADMGEILSGGNFHGEYPAKSLDYLAIGVHELANMSERRTERLVNPALSELPAFLTPDGGLNSGFMIAHCTAASLVTAAEFRLFSCTIDFSAALIYGPPTAAKDGAMVKYTIVSAGCCF